MEKLRIGTRSSKLALWQAEKVAAKIQKLGIETEVIPSVSHGDKNLTKPLYAIGITGIFTKDLDIALLDNKIDIAVHSLKDVPTLLPTGVSVSAVLERDYPQDILVRSSEAKEKPLSKLSIATSSLRRRAFWLNEFPEAEFTDMRGNVGTRLEKIENGVADATLLSLAGIKRMEMDIEYEEVPFLLQAPSQGVVCCTSLEANKSLTTLLNKINHRETERCTEIERAFLRHLEGGCTAPIGAKATMDGDKVKFEGRLVNLLGTLRVDIVEVVPWEKDLGVHFAQKALAMGGDEIMREIKTQL